MTEIIVTKRGGGKTTTLIAMSAETGYYIICNSIQEAQRIFRIAIEAGFNIPLPITYDDFKRNRYYGNGIRGFLFDNAEDFLQSMTVVPIKAITVSECDKDPKL